MWHFKAAFNTLSVIYSLKLFLGQKGKCKEQGHWVFFHLNLTIHWQNPGMLCKSAHKTLFWSHVLGSKDQNLKGLEHFLNIYVVSAMEDLTETVVCLLWVILYYMQCSIQLFIHCVLFGTPFEAIQMWWCYSTNFREYEIKWFGDHQIIHRSNPYA